MAFVVLILLLAKTTFSVASNFTYKLQLLEIRTTFSEQCCEDAKYWTFTDLTVRCNDTWVPFQKSEKCNLYGINSSAANFLRFPANCTDDFGVIEYRDVEKVFNASSDSQIEFFVDYHMYKLCFFKGSFGYTVEKLIGENSQTFVLNSSDTGNHVNGSLKFFLSWNCTDEHYFGRHCLV